MKSCIEKSDYSLVPALPSFVPTEFYKCLYRRGILAVYNIRVTLRFQENHFEQCPVDHPGHSSAATCSLLEERSGTRPRHQYRALHTVLCTWDCARAVGGDEVGSG